MDRERDREERQGVNGNGTRGKVEGRRYRLINVGRSRPGC